MGVEHGGVERCDEQIQISEHNCHGTVDDAVGAVDESLGLVRIARRVGCEGKWRVCQVELLAPSNPGRLTGGSGCHVAVVGTNGCAKYQQLLFHKIVGSISTFTGSFPGKEDFLAGERKRLRFVLQK